nr:8808_t:CDS:2 [Entrophospora candida]
MEDDLISPKEKECIDDGDNDTAFTISFLPNTGNKYFFATINDTVKLYDFETGQRDKNKEWCNEDIATILSVSYRIPSTQDLYLICQDIIVERPLILFESPIFPSIDEELLLRILELDIICLPEIMIFNKLIEWGIANTPGYDTLTNNASQMDALGDTLENGLQLIRYRNMSREEKMSILNFERILPTEKVKDQIPPRINSPVEPKFISSRFAGLISTWIDRKDPTEAPYTGLNTPFRFRLVFRMGDQTTFYQEHRKYYNQSSSRILPTIKCHHGPSLMLMKLRRSGKIIGAYNPIDWKQDLLNKVYVCTSESFIFSCEDRYGTNHRLSRVRDFDHAICLEGVNPSGVILKFGEDLIFNPMRGYVKCNVENKFYEQPKILDEEGRYGYEIEKWEIYRVRRKDDQPMMIINEDKHKVSPRINLPVETKIIDSDFFGLIATWIDRNDPVKERYTGSEMPIQFRPVFRMKDLTDFYREHSKYYNHATDRLLPTMKCHHGPSLMIMKLKTSGKIIGAYNPINWKQNSCLNEYKSTSESFIFSSEDIHGTNHQLSRVKNIYRAICSEQLVSVLYSNIEVPNSVQLRFGSTLRISYDENDYSLDSTPSVTCCIQQNEDYEQPAVISAGYYDIDEWEIFRVIKKDNQILHRIDSPEPKIINRITSPPRIVYDNFLALIATWIDRKDPTKNPYTEFNMPFQFRHKCGRGHQLSRVKNFDKAISQVNIYPNGVLLKFGEDLSFIYMHGNIHTDEPDYGLEDDIVFPSVGCRVKENGFYEQPPVLPGGIYEIDGWEEPKLQPYDVMEVMKLPKEFPDNYWQFHDNSGHGMINYINKQNPLELFNVKQQVMIFDENVLINLKAIIEEVLSIKSVTFKEENYYIESIGVQMVIDEVDNINYDEEENGPALYGEYRNWTSEEITILLKYNLELC